MDKCMDWLGEATVFLRLDVSSGYLPIEIKNNDKNKKSFTTHHELYRFVRMPLGLSNAPKTFWHTTDVSLSSVGCQFVLIYLDDTTIFSKTSEQRIKHFQNVLSLLHSTSATIKLKNRNFFINTIDYLGHIIRLSRLKLASYTSDAIRKLNVTNQHHGIEIFLEIM